MTHQTHVLGGDDQEHYCRLCGRRGVELNFICPGLPQPEHFRPNPGNPRLPSAGAVAIEHAAEMLNDWPSLADVALNYPNISMDAFGVKAYDELRKTYKERDDLYQRVCTLEKNLSSLKASGTKRSRK